MVLCCVARGVAQLLFIFGHYPYALLLTGIDGQYQRTLAIITFHSTLRFPKVVHTGVITLGASIHKSSHPALSIPASLFRYQELNDRVVSILGSKHQGSGACSVSNGSVFD
eukprot:XP_001709897.1 Hypothetical protein GL50803_32488 [Giardia lamblia ATCC 50803]